MSRFEEQRDWYTFATQPACVSSMPRGFYVSVDQKQPWLFCDPFLRAELRALYRSVRFTLLALFAMLTCSKQSRGASPQGSDVVWSQAPDRADCLRREYSGEVDGDKQISRLHALNRSESADSLLRLRTWNAPKGRSGECSGPTCSCPSYGALARRVSYYRACLFPN